MKDLLVEIFTEEIPHNFINNAENGITNIFIDFLKENGISFASYKSFSTPRRLAVLINNVDEEQKDSVKEQRGPLYTVAVQNGEVSKAGEGFIISQGYAPEDLLKAGREETTNAPFIKDFKGKEYIFVKKLVKGVETKEILKENFESLILKLNFPKKMRWGSGDFSFVRPIHNIIFMFGEEVIDIKLGSVSSSNKVFGHRILSYEAEELKNPSDYESVLEKKSVIASRQKRHESILAQLEEIEEKYNSLAVGKDKVSSIVVNLTEEPHLITAEFDARFLEVPEEVLISEMIEHQMYFPLRDKDGKLTNRFVITANQKETENIRDGNVRVLTARLSDGRFLYKEDLKRGIRKMNEDLSSHLFRKELGSTKDKSLRLKEHLKAFATETGVDERLFADTNTVIELMKGDLLSHMVQEFAELQGVMGGYFAKDAGLNENISLAIKEHYLPVSASDNIPSNEEGTLASICDKLDNIISAFYVGDIPTGSQDPNGLRRQSLGVMRMLIEREYSLSLKSLLPKLIANYPKIENSKSVQEVALSVLSFMATRFEVWLKEEFSYDAIGGVLSLGLDNVYESYLKIKAVDSFRENNKSIFERLHTVFKRAANITEGNESFSVNEVLLTEDAEKALYNFYLEKKGEIESLVSKREYSKALEGLSKFYEPMDSFFASVMVMVDDESVKKNRVALLTAIDSLFQNMLNFKVIAGN